MGFKKSVLSIALVIFIIVLLILAVVIKNSYKNAVFPPEISYCPDYWEIADDKKSCKAGAQNLGTFTSGKVVENSDRIDFSDMSNSGRIKKCNWAKENGVSWDGITGRNLC